MIQHHLKRCFALLGFLCIVGWSFAQETTAFTLNDAIEYAYSNSLSIRNAQLKIEDADAQVMENKAIGLPQLNGSLEFQRYLEVPISVLPEAFVASARDSDGNLPEGFSREVTFLLKNQFTAGATLSSLIFDGTYLVGLRAARTYKDYVQRELSLEKRTVRNQVIDAYLPALLITESKKTLDKNIANIEKLLFETTEFYKAGFVEQLDIDRLELSLANLRTEQENLERQLETVSNALKFATGFPMDNELVLTDKLEDLLAETTEEDLIGEINYSKRPELGVVEEGMNLNQLNIDRYKMGYYPSVAGYLSYQYAYQGDNFSDGFWYPTSVIGVQVDVPIFDGFSKKAKIQRAQLELQMTQNQKTELQRGIALEVQNARTQYISAKERVNSQEKNVALADKIYTTTQIKYKEGVGSSVELAQAEQALYEAQQNYTQSIYDLLVAKEALDKALGN